MRAGTDCAMASHMSPGTERNAPLKATESPALLPVLPAVLLASVTSLVAACGPAPGDGTRPPSCGVAPLVFDPSGDVLQGSDDDGACVRIERRPIGEPDVMYKEYPYEPLRLTAAAGDTFLDVTEASALGYTPTHHNWLDQMTGTDDDGTEATIVIRYRVAEGDWVLELTLTDAAGVVLAGPLALTPARS